MNFKLIEIRQRTPPEVLVILSRSRASLTFLVLTAFISFAAFMILKDFFPSYTEPKKHLNNKNTFRNSHGILNESFDAPSDEWWSEENDSVTAGINDGKYVIHLKINSSYPGYMVTQPVKKGEKTLSAETHKIKGNQKGFGLMMIGKTEKIQFLITSKGKYALLKHYLNETTFINESGKYDFSPLIHQGNNPNTLKINFHDDHLELWVNGEKLETVRLWYGFYIQRVGFIVHSNQNHENLVHFDNLFYGEQIQQNDVNSEEPYIEDVSLPEFIIAQWYQDFAYSNNFPEWMIIYSWPVYLIFGLFILFLFLALKNVLIPTEHRFDGRKKVYFRNGKPFMKFNEIKGVDVQKSGGNTDEGGGKPMYVYPVSLILNSRGRIKLFSAGSEQEAYSLRDKIRKLIQFEDGVLTPEEKEEKLRTKDLPAWYRLTWLIGFIIFGTFLIGLWLDFIPESWKFPWFITFFVVFAVMIFGRAFVSKSP